jgi:hypothetical protein
MDEIKPQRKNRFEKGSEAAKEFMATLRAKKGNKPPAPPAPPAPSSPPSPPASAGSIPSSLEPKRRNKKNITVDFS